MKVKNVIVLLIGMILFAGKASAQQVKTDYDRSANFTQYKTYSWEQVKTKDALDAGRIKSAVNAVLATKGWTPVDSGGDVSIVAMEITRNQQTLNTFYDGFGGGWGWRRRPEYWSQQLGHLGKFRRCRWCCWRRGSA